MLERRKRPTRGEIDAAALTLLSRHGAQILALARRYTASGDDAEDAYQRAIEILLTKAPTTREEELVPWLKTVVKHEAFALRRQRERLTPVTSTGEPVERGTAPAATHDQAERYERLLQGAEALRRLKPQEVRCLVLRAQGLSYREICKVTGFTYTKVNRCLTEGRQALAARLAGIESGVECERIAPLLSALADGEADAAALAALRPHLRTCLSCRARLREFRAAPARVAALVPAAVVLGGGSGPARSLLESLVSAAQHKAAAVGERAHAAAELVTGQKVAAVAASAAALAGGGTAVDQLANHHGPPLRAAVGQAESAPTPEVEQSEPSPPPLQPPTAPSTESPAAERAAATHEPSQPPPPDPANEFAPAADAAFTSTGAAAASPPAEPSAAAPTTGATPAGGPGAEGGAAREFAP